MFKYRHNAFLLLRTVLSTFLHADWKGSRERHGFWGVLAESFRSLVGTNAWPFFIDGESGWDRGRISKLLKSHGVSLWGWGYHQGQFFFRVKKKQAHWAQYILLSNGVPVRGRLLEGQGAATDDAQVLAGTNKRNPEKRATDIVDEIGKVVDVIASW